MPYPSTASARNSSVSVTSAPMAHLSRQNSRSPWSPCIRSKLFVWSKGRRRRNTTFFRLLGTRNTRFLHRARSTFGKRSMCSAMPRSTWPTSLGWRSLAQSGCHGNPLSLIRTGFRNSQSLCCPPSFPSRCASWQDGVHLRLQSGCVLAALGCRTNRAVLRIRKR